MQNDYILKMTDISKTFNGVTVLNKVSLAVRRGTVHALMGENGAGKSTLMKILFGIYTKDPGKGQVLFEGQELGDMSASKSKSVGIAMIHQELMTIPDMTVADNLFIGRYNKKSPFVSRNEINTATNKLLTEYELNDISADMNMRGISQANRQMVEILKAVSQNAKLIIMDEPTSSLSETEIETLYRIIRQLKAGGISIIYISHKLDEIFTITDEYTVFRDGTFIGTGLTKEITEHGLIEMMVGRSLENLYNKKDLTPGDEILRVEGLSSGTAFHDISFSVRRGEVFGISGLVGAGRTELVETIMGMRTKTSGRIWKDGKEINNKNVRSAIANRMAMATEDRKRYGLFLGLPISFNISISWIKAFCNKLQLVNHRKEIKDCGKVAEKLKVKYANLGQMVGDLSGGNQQKIVLAKWLLTEADILILDEPTRGIDVGAKSEIYNLIEEMASEGKAIIMVSSEALEILGMSDRVLVMRDGEMTGIYEREELDQAKIVGY